jgi:hypothetical protein
MAALKSITQTPTKSLSGRSNNVQWVGRGFRGGVVGSVSVVE